MQTYTELTSSLGCSDCKSSFNSASLLLQHFAQHVSQEASGDQLKHVDNWSSDDAVQCMQKQPTPLHLQKKKKKTETILERVLKRNSALRHFTSHCEPGPSTSHEDIRTFSSTSLSSSLPVLQTTDPEYVEQSGVFKAMLGALVVSESGTPLGRDMLVEIGQRAREKNSRGLKPSFSSSSLPSSSSEVQLVKCDLQKRLESCITKLSSKHENGLTSENEGVAIMSETNTKRQLDSVKSKQNSELLAGKSDVMMEEAQECAKSNEDLEDFNPLKFCFVTLEETEENVEHQKQKLTKEFIAKSPRGASNRKQKTPKKVHYSQNGEMNHNTEGSSVMPNIPELSVTLVPGDVDKVVSSSTAKRKYPCHLCSKVFGWSTDLKRHILTHTGERPFKCVVCQATFTRNFLLQKHQSKIHNSCFATSKQGMMSNSQTPLSNEDIENSGKKELDHQNERCDVKRSTTELTRCGDDEKLKRSRPDCLELSNGMKSHETWHSICPAKKRKELQCKISSFEIFSHEALNIL